MALRLSQDDSVHLARNGASLVLDATAYPVPALVQVARNLQDGATLRIEGCERMLRDDMAQIARNRGKGQVVFA